MAREVNGEEIGNDKDRAWLESPEGWGWLSPSGFFAALRMTAETCNGIAMATQSSPWPGDGRGREADFRDRSHIAEDEA
jgi:hypothetical protein